MKAAEYKGNTPRYMQSDWHIRLTENQHGIVARYATNNHMMMDTAIEHIFALGLAQAILRVQTVVQVRSGVKERQPTAPSAQPEGVAA